MKYLSLITFLIITAVFSTMISAENNFLKNFKADEITEDVYVIHGPNADPSPENQGFINNPGFVVVDNGVVVIDPGSSRAIGKMVLGEINRISSSPVIAIFNTHEHGDHWLGNQSIIEAFPGIPIYAHDHMIKSIEDGAGNSWLSLMQQLTDNAITGTEINAPTHTVKHGDEISLGNKTFKIHHYGISHTHNDIMVEVIESSTVFLGDNVFMNRLPRLDDGDVKKNIHSIKEIMKAESKHYVPGHGPSGDSSVPETYLEYLETLYQSVQTLYEEDLSDFEMKDQVQAALNKFSDWYGFESALGRNISLVYLQIENEDF